MGRELAVSDFDESIETLVIRELMPEYIASMKGKIKQMALASRRSDYGAIKTIASQLKGTGRAFGLPRISDAGKAIATASEAADESAVARHLSDLERILGRLRAYGTSSSHSTAR